MDTTTDRTSPLAAGAIIGPVTFIGAWVAGGLSTPGYSAITDPISDLAAVGADTASLMNTGLAAYGVGIPMAAWAMRKIIGTPASVALALNGLLTFGVLATPLERSEAVDQAHAVFAGSAYVALAAAVLLASRKLERRWLRRTSVVVGSITAVSLIATIASDSSGLFQRIGLTTSDLWLIGMGAAVMTGRMARD
jgi:hypothetical membrane protein